MGIINQKTGHVSKFNKEAWFERNYSVVEKKKMKISIGPVSDRKKAIWFNGN
jgi:hypothetical protein